MLSFINNNFDVFISDRVASDSHHAELLYNLLVDKNIKVWWDQKSLEFGIIIIIIIDLLYHKYS